MKTTLSKIIGSTILATGVAVSLVAAPAQAAVLSKTLTLGTQVCKTSDISLGGDLGPLVKATDCAGSFQGNDTGAGNPLLSELKGGLFSDNFNINQKVTWSEITKVEKAGGSGSFGFNADVDKSTGDWGFGTKLETDTFVVSLKSSTYYSAYLFKDYDWKQGLDGIFSTIGVSTKKDKAQALSHAALFAANVTTVNPPSVEVPEPTTLVGLGLAFGGMLASRRRQSN